MASRDDAIVDIFIPVLNEAEGASYELAERPDEIVRNKPDIEAVAKDRTSGATLRIEHTRLEPFEGEGADFGRLRDIAEAIEKDGRIAQVNRELDISFKVGAFDVFGRWGRDKERVLRTIVEWLRVNVPSFESGYSEHTLTLPEPLVIGISLEHLEGAGSVSVARRDAPPTLLASLRRSVTRKLPKLVVETATKHVLLLEKYVPLHSRYEIGRQLRSLAPDLPDLSGVEVWVADTNGWHSADVVGFYRVWPSVDRRTRWVRGIPEVKLLHKRHLM